MRSKLGVIFLVAAIVTALQLISWYQGSTCLLWAGYRGTTCLIPFPTGD